jgi:hypothetical protein
VIRPRSPRLALVLILALGLLARLVRWAADFPIWGDEGFVACNFLTRDLRRLLQPLEFGMVAPVGWLVPSFWLSKLLGPEPWVLRLPALAAGSAALLLFAPFARRVLGRTAGVAAAALFAASYYLVRHSAEVKPYAFDLLFGLLITARAWRLIRPADSSGRVRSSESDLPPADTDPPARATDEHGTSPPRSRPVNRRSAWVAFTVLAAGAVWCSYPAAFVAAGALLVLGGVVVSERRRNAAFNWLLSCAIVGASFVAMYALVGRHQQWTEERIADARHWDDHFLPVERPWIWPWWLLRELTGNMLAYPNGGPRFGSSATFLLAAAGAASLWRAGRRREVLLFASPLLPMLVASALRRYPFGGSARITLHLAVPVCLLAARGLVSVLWAWKRRDAAGDESIARARRAARGMKLFALGMALWCAATIAADLVHPYKSKGDVLHRDAVAWLRDRSRPGDRWVVFGRLGLDEPGHAAGSAPWPRAPDLVSWRGSGGRLRYYLLLDARSAGAELLWAPPPEAILPGGEPPDPRAPKESPETRDENPAKPSAPQAGEAEVSRRLWLIVYHDNEAAFPEDAFADYHAVLESHAGARTAEQTFILGPASRDPITGASREESITVFRFEPRRS